VKLEKGMRLSNGLTKKIAWYLKPFFWNQKRKYGQALEPAKVWATNPKLFLAVASVFGILDRKKSPISPALRSLVSVRIAQLNWCAFCVDLNTANWIKRSGNASQIEQLSSWQTSTEFTNQEKAALAYAEQMNQNNKPVDDACYHALRTYFDEHAIIELTAIISFQIMSSKFNSALQIEPQGLCSLNKHDKHET
jgi:AhpD family alkylhydroperoxidase